MAINLYRPNHRLSLLYETQHRWYMLYTSVGHWYDIRWGKLKLGVGVLLYSVLLVAESRRDKSLFLLRLRSYNKPLVGRTSFRYERCRSRQLNV